MEHKTDLEIIETTHNTARFFVEQRHVAWVLLIGTMLWGIFGYWKMPQRKDPDIPVREAMAIVPWPGMPAEKGGAARHQEGGDDHRAERQGYRDPLDQPAREPPSST